MMRQPASLTAGSRDGSSTGDRRAAHTPGTTKRKPLSTEYIGRMHSDALRAVSNVKARRAWGNSKTGSPVATIELCVEIARLNNERDEMLFALRVVLAMTEDFLTDPTQHQDHVLIALDAARAAIAISDHQNAPTDDATGQRSGLSP